MPKSGAASEPTELAPKQEAAGRGRRGESAPTAGPPGVGAAAAATGEAWPK
jgi:hypothetical protein